MKCMTCTVANVPCSLKVSAHIHMREGRKMKLQLLRFDIYVWNCFLKKIYSCRQKSVTSPSWGDQASFQRSPRLRCSDVSFQACHELLLAISQFFMTSADVLFSLLCSRWTYDTPGATILHYPSVETRVVVCHFMTTTVLLYATSVVWNVCLTNFPRKFKFFSPFFEVSLKGSHSLALIVLCSRSRAVGWKVARLLVVLGRKVAPIPNWSKVVRSITLFTTVYSTRDYSIINWSKGLFNYIPISLYIPNNPNWSKVAPIGVRLLQFAPKH